MLTVSPEKLHRRCSIGLPMCLRLKVLSMRGLGGLQVYGIRSRRLYSVQFAVYSVKWLRLDQNIRKLTCGNLEFLLVAIQLGVTG